MNSASIGDIGFNETYIESMVLNFTIVNSQDFPQFSRLFNQRDPNVR